MNDYTYEPLTYHDQIRILTLMPGSNQDPLETTLTSIRLSSIPSSAHAHPWAWGQELFEDSVDPPNEKRPQDIIRAPIYTFYCHRTEYAPMTYDALSYTWGDPEKVEHVMVGGKRLGTARNLHLGLLRLRHPKELRRLWIDAICINQDDNNERNHQVKMMQRVYSSASSVIVWLGELEPHLALTLGMILDYNNHLKARTTIFSYKPAALRGLGELFQRPWWRRIWIVQEVVAAQEIVVLLGSITFPWLYLRNICSHAYENETTKDYLGALLKSIEYQRFRDLDYFRSQDAMPIVHLLRLTQDYQATDPRDKLYAVLGMTSDISTQDLAPNYNKPVRMVFQELIYFLGLRRGNLDLICLEPWPTQTQQVSKFWLSPWLTTVGVQPAEEEATPHQAAADTRAVVDMSRFPHIIFAQGVIADTVELSGGSARVTNELPGTHQLADLVGVEGHTANLYYIVAVAFSRLRKGQLDWYDIGLLLQIPVNDRWSKAKKLSDMITQIVMGRQFFTMENGFFTTKHGRVGLCPAGVETDDRIVVLKGCHVPFIIRPAKDHWTVVGEAYVSDMMFGEVIQEAESGRYKITMIALSYTR